MKALVVRGATGVATWSLRGTGTSAHDWVCSRDNFVVHGPTTTALLEQCMTQLAQHSQQLVGAISQVVELDL